MKCDLKDSEKEYLAQFKTSHGTIEEWARYLIRNRLSAFDSDSQIEMLLGQIFRQMNDEAVSSFADMA